MENINSFKNKSLGDTLYEIRKQKGLPISKEYLRNKRKKLLEAFDVYKTNVNYGIITEKNRAEIIAWYDRILNLDEDSIINNIPEDIKKYIK